LSTTTVQHIIDLCLSRANQENTNVFGQQEMTDYVNNSLAEMYDILTTTYEDYDSHTYHAVLNGSLNVIPVPSDVNKVRLVEYKYITAGSGSSSIDDYYPLNLFQMPQRNRYGNTPLNIFLPYQLAQLTYRVMGGKIYIEPVASAQGEYRIWYVQKWQYLESTDYLPDIMDTQAWWEYAIVDTAIKMYDKLQWDASGFRQEKMELKDRIVSAAKNRTLGNPRAMVNVRRRNRFGFGWSSGGMF
jgi:hypothetical protein